MFRDIDTIKDLTQKMNKLENKIRYISNIQERFIYQRELQDIINRIIQLELKMKREMNQLPTFTLKMLEEFNGRDGKKAYVAVDGFVYDVTKAKSWEKRNHYGLQPGMDLTKAFRNCHGTDDILNKLKIVRLLKNE